ncbi:hypothetical protein L7F22_011250 [Adiantum nelumboides]|nr:hypothetical protein [Adiantum nelumboides]
MQAIHSSTCLELPPLRSRNECGFKEAASTSYKDAALPANLRLDQKDRAFMFPLRLEATGRSSEWQNPIQELEAVQRLEATVLKACAMSAALADGEQTHAHVLEHGLDSDVFRRGIASLSTNATTGRGARPGNILIDMYAKLGSLDSAKLVFSRLPDKNVVTWSTLIVGYVQHGLGQEALGLFQQMEQEGIKPNHVTFLGILKACSSMAALDHGKAIQATIVDNGLEFNGLIASSLLDMYAKCGKHEDVHILFDRLPSRDNVVWGTLIGAHAHHNDYKGTLKYFKAMLQAGLKPDEVTFLCLLSACCRAGMLDEGCAHFKSMPEIYGMWPDLEHYDCLVDLYSFDRRFDAAEDLLETIHYNCNVVGWKALLTACRRHGNVLLGRRCFEQVVKCEPGNASGFALMSSTYTHIGLWEESTRLEVARRHANAWKVPAKACIEVENEIHSFTVGDTTHPFNEKIQLKLKSITASLLEEGYPPHYNLIPSAMSIDCKQDALCGHSERLAIAFGLLSTPQGVTLRLANAAHVNNSLLSSNINLDQSLTGKFFNVNWG